MLRVSGKIVSSFWKKSPLTSSNFGHSNIVCTIVSEPWPQQGHAALRVSDIRAAEDRRPMLPFVFNVHRSASSQQHPGACDATIASVASHSFPCPSLPLPQASHPGHPIECGPAGTPRTRSSSQDVAACAGRPSEHARQSQSPTGSTLAAGRTFQRPCAHDRSAPPVLASVESRRRVILWSQPLNLAAALRGKADA